MTWDVTNDMKFYIMVVFTPPRKNLGPLAKVWEGFVQRSKGSMRVELNFTLFLPLNALKSGIVIRRNDMKDIRSAGKHKKITGYYCNV